jgi:hypothetical protein
MVNVAMAEWGEEHLKRMAYALAGAALTKQSISTPESPLAALRIPPAPLP